MGQLTKEKQLERERLLPLARAFDRVTLELPGFWAVVDDTSRLHLGREWGKVRRGELDGTVAARNFTRWANKKVNSCSS